MDMGKFYIAFGLILPLILTVSLASNNKMPLSKKFPLAIFCLVIPVFSMIQLLK